MVVRAASKTLHNIPSKGKISVMKIQNFTVQRRHTVLRVAYGCLMMVVAIAMAVINPVAVITNWYLEMKEGSFLYKMWEAPPYDLYSEVWVYNYTNVKEYIDGKDSKLNISEVGPFTFREIRTNENITVDRETGVMTMNPKLSLKFVRELSIADIEDVTVMVPNIALIALSTLAADRFGYIPNTAAYYSMKAIGSKLFNKLTIEKLFWGYKDPLVSFANTIVPGWIDFGRLGILDRFYPQRQEKAQTEIKNPTSKYELVSWDDSPGLVQQGYKNINTSNKCNRIKGTFEGIMVTPDYPKGKDIPVFRKQACRVYPFSFLEEVADDNGFNYYRYMMSKSAFSKTSPYACNCTVNCLPEGFVDVSSCYYGFPIALSKTHFLDVDPQQTSYFEGIVPDPVKDASFLEIEPTIGVPVRLKSNIQVNIAVRTSVGNPLTKPLKDKVVPLVWLSMYCKGPPDHILSLFRLRFAIAPPLIISLEVILFVVGMILTTQGIHRIIRPRYRIIETEKPAHQTTKVSLERRKSIEKIKSQEKRKGCVVFNSAENSLYIKEHDDLAKEAVSLLGINEEDFDVLD